ncbi:hypothetical protein LCGC14_1318950 [marine sediment metagenome]|uniref:Uncharacterized protein n=1 Tax=marine sediment metagenome TaxID=412755 RepID=A0A0F9N0X4_9ZZZZ
MIVQNYGTLDIKKRVFKILGIVLAVILIISIAAFLVTHRSVIAAQNNVYVVKIKTVNGWPSTFKCRLPPENLGTTGFMFTKLDGKKLYTNSEFICEEQ